MSRRQRIDCPHERRPGMAVCLHCLHAARVAARDRRQRAILRVVAWTLIIVVVGIVGAAGANAVARHPDVPAIARTTKRVPNPTRARDVPPPSRVDSTALTVAVAPVVQQGAPTPAPVVSAADSQMHGSTTAAPAAAAVRAPADSVTTSAPGPSVKMGPIVGQGRTDFADSLFAIRSGETVVVHFDTSPARTRRADKFDSIVRQTLRSVYGAIADTILAAVPPGQLAAPNELLTTLPKKGIHLTAPHGVALTLWPETRPGRDGPLVVAYRVRVEH